MRHLFVMDPLHRIRVETDSTWMIMGEARRRGGTIHQCEPGHLFLRGGEVHARAWPVRPMATAPWFDVDPPEEHPLGAWDLVWMRKDPPVDLDYLFATWLLALAAPVTTVVNDPVGLATGNEKLLAQQWPDLSPHTVVTSDLPRIRTTVETMGRAVLKPWNACGGLGVVLTGAGDPNLGALAELLTGQGQHAVVVQQYLEAAPLGDKRILLVDGEPRGWLNRVPVPGDHRGNIHVGARVERCGLSPEDRAICDRIGPWLARNGMLFTGIDVIGGRLTEVNITSPTGIQEANRLLGVRVEADILDAALHRAARRRGGSP